MYHDTEAIKPVPEKKKRGRPPKNPQPIAQAGNGQGSGAPPPGNAFKDAAQAVALKRDGPALIPDVLVVNAGEDVVAKLRELAHHLRHNICVLAANGTVSSATLAQVGASAQGVGLTLKGQYTVLSISGSVLFAPPDQDGGGGSGAAAAAGTSAQGAAAGGSGSASASARPGPPAIFLSTSMANPSGGVVGGLVAGAMVASQRLTVVVGHWDPAAGKAAAPAQQAAAVKRTRHAADEPAAAPAGGDGRQAVACGEDEGRGLAEGRGQGDQDFNHNEGDAQ